MDKWYGAELGEKENYFFLCVNYVLGLFFLLGIAWLSSRLCLEFFLFFFSGLWVPHLSGIAPLTSLTNLFLINFYR